MRKAMMLLATALLLPACAREGDEVANAGSTNEPPVQVKPPLPTPPKPDQPREAPKAQPQPKTASACLTQDNKPVPPNRLRAIGTEPFWGARVEGRCVTYSHPEDQQGTRVWTRFSGTASNGSWSGSLNGSPFVMRTRPQADCSDGMSDNRYPIAVTLTVGGEERLGCAVPL